MKIAYKIKPLWLFATAVPLFWTGAASAAASDSIPPPPPPPILTAPSVNQTQASVTPEPSSATPSAPATMTKVSMPPSSPHLSPVAVQKVADETTRSDTAPEVKTSAEAPPADPAPAAKTVADTLPPGAMPVAKQVIVAVTSPAAPIAAVPSPAPATAKSATDSNMKELENKIPDTVKDAVKRLDKTTEDVTLDDLNSARQAVAKIEALTEIEKRLVELEKVRHEREKESNNVNLAAMIPASALQAPMAMPPMFAQPTAMAGGPQGMAMPVMPKTVLELSRVMGGGGHYSAVLKMSGDETKTVRVGERLPDGSLVTSITSTEVVLEHDNDRHVLHVKNVDTVFGNSL